MTMTALRVGRFGFQLARKFVFPVSYRQQRGHVEKLCQQGFGTKNFATVKSSPVMSSDKLVWIDMEMTGLDVNVDQIMEVACVITNWQLTEIVGSFDLVIHQPDEILDNMNDWCKKQHAKTGLTEECRKSTIGIQDAEEQLLSFVAQHVPKGVSPLAGNSVYMDRFFLMKYMPQLNNYLHYRLIDVSTLKELSRKWTPNLSKQMTPKSFSHRGLSDILESIEELKFYKENFFDSHELSKVSTT